MKLIKIIMPGKTNLRYLLISQESNDSRMHSHIIQAEQKTYILCTYLKQAHLIAYASFERRTSFRIDTKNVLGQQKSIAASTSSG